jgi:hypothetical protein
MWIAHKYRGRETGRPAHGRSSELGPAVCRRRLGWTPKRRAGAQKAKKQVAIRP